MGTEGNFYIDGGRFELIPELRFPKNKPEEQNLNPKLPRGRDFYPAPDGELLRLQNWIDRKTGRDSNKRSGSLPGGKRRAAATSDESERSERPEEGLLRRGGSGWF